MMSGGNNEVEIKLRVANRNTLRRRLTGLRLRPASKGRVRERNILFDTPPGGLAKHGQLLRIRIEEGRNGAIEAILTYKGPAVRDTPPSAIPMKHYKVRREIEVQVADPGRLRAIFEALGLRGWFHYEKYRTNYRVPDSLGWAAGLQVELDETPIGDFLELEGPPEAIDRMAELLDYGRKDYLTKSYLALYLEHCRKQGLPAVDMVFPSRKKQ